MNFTEMQNPAARAAGASAEHPLVPRAADMKAAGASWDAVARELEIPVEELREWPRVYRGQWKHEYAFAAEQVTGECVAESLHTLRRHMRDRESDVSLAAAALLAKIQMTGTRHGGPAKAAEAKAKDDPWATVPRAAYDEAKMFADMTDKDLSDAAD